MVRHWNENRGLVGSLLSLLAIASACASDDKGSGPRASGSDDGISLTSGASTGGDLDSTSGGSGEQELEASFRAPVVSGSYLWTANPESDRVARIHAGSLEVELLEAGHGPTFLSALPEGATEGGALVLNELSQDASIYILDGDGNVQSSDRYDVQEGASAWAVSKKGKFAIAWSKFGDSNLPGIDGHQDLTLFDFSGDEIETSMLAVGYRPSEVFINEAETLAYVVCDPGISVIDLAKMEVIREIFLPEGNLVGSRDIEFSPDGKLAMSRTQGSPDVLLIDTMTSKIKSLQLPGVITDLDMSQDGDIAIAVVRGSSQPSEEMPTAMGGMGGLGGGGGAPGMEFDGQPSVVALMDPKTVFGDPDFEELLTEEIVGSVVIASDGSQAVLYTNASDNSHMTVLDAKSRELRVVDLKAPARAAFLSEDGAFAVALMSPPSGSSKSGAFALVPIAEDLPPRIEGTENLPEHVSLSGASMRALVTTKEDAEGHADTYFAQFPGLLVDRIRLSSRALATGLVPDENRGFVAQEHAEGRVTFVDLESGKETTVTGFELAAKVVD